MCMKAKPTQQERQFSLFSFSTLHTTLAYTKFSSRVHFSHDFLPHSRNIFSSNFPYYRHFVLSWMHWNVSRAKRVNAKSRKCGKQRISKRFSEFSAAHWAVKFHHKNFPPSHFSLFFFVHNIKAIYDEQKTQKWFSFWINTPNSTLGHRSKNCQSSELLIGAAIESLHLNFLNLSSVLCLNFAFHSLLLFIFFLPLRIASVRISFKPKNI